MFPRALNHLRNCVLKRRYVMTIHAEEEMCNDGLTIYDVESGILTGAIEERQKDQATGEWKYCLRGETLRGETLEMITKIGPLNKMVIITVYRD